MAVSDQKCGVPMPGSEKATGRLVALIALLLLAGVALHGYLPGDEPAPRQPARGGPATLFGVVAVLGVSLTIVALAIVAWLRDPRRRSSTPHQLPRGIGGSRERPKWRFLLLCLGAFLVWLLIVMLLTRLTGPLHGVGRSTAPTAPNPATRSDGTPPPARGTRVRPPGVRARRSRRRLADRRQACADGSPRPRPQPAATA